MSSNPNLRREILSMKCHLCKNFLSVPPIMLLSEDGKQLKCGRCTNDDQPTMGRNFALENLASFFSFPCVHQGCKKFIPWKEVEDHEYACDYRPVQCPVIYSCQKIIRVRNLKRHMARDHSKKIHSDTFSFEIEVTADKAAVYTYTPHLMISDDQLFLVMLRRVETILYLYVASLANVNESFVYDLKLYSISKHSQSVLFEGQSIERYNETFNCFRCVIKQCQLSQHPHSNVNGNVPILLNCKKIDLTGFYPIFGETPRIGCSIDIRRKKSSGRKNKEPMDGIYTVKCLIDHPTFAKNCFDLVRKQLQCPICVGYMTSGIYSCQKGHVVCKSCRLQLVNCPSCRTKLGTSRNFPLEALAEEIVLACPYFENGCHFTGKLKLLGQHETSCEYEQKS